jgi:hypothetical protein
MGDSESNVCVIHVASAVQMRSVTYVRCKVISAPGGVFASN